MSKPCLILQKFRLYIGSFFRLDLCVFETPFVLLRKSAPISRFPPDRQALHAVFYFRWFQLRSERTFYRSLPVHWYHLFVSIRYHKFSRFSIPNIVQTNEALFVKNIDLYISAIFLYWLLGKYLIWWSCWGGFSAPFLCASWRMKVAAKTATFFFYIFEGEGGF